MAQVIWAPSPADAWVPATIISNSGKDIVVMVKGTGENLTIPGPVSQYDIVTPGSLEQYCDNLVDLETYSEGIILHHIRTRFAAGVIYTYVGRQ